MSSLVTCFPAASMILRMSQRVIVARYGATNLNFTAGNGCPTLPLISLSDLLQHVAQPTSVIPYTCTILASGLNFEYNCCCIPSVAHEPATKTHLKDFSFSFDALDSAIIIGGTIAVCVIRKASTALRKAFSSNRGMIYVGVPARSGNPCWSGMVKT